MADESQLPCVMCHESNEQMLMLSCVHDPCVNCAAIHFVENQSYNSGVCPFLLRFTHVPNVDKKLNLMSPVLLNLEESIIYRIIKGSPGIHHLPSPKKTLE